MLYSIFHSVTYISAFSLGCLVQSWSYIEVFTQCFYLVESWHKEAFKEIEEELLSGYSTVYLHPDSVLFFKCHELKFSRSTLQHFHLLLRLRGFVLLTENYIVYYSAKNKMASVQKETNNAITLKGSTEIVADFFGKENILH